MRPAAGPSWTAPMTPMFVGDGPRARSGGRGRLSQRGADDAARQIVDEAQRRTDAHVAALRGPAAGVRREGQGHRQAVDARAARARTATAGSVLRFTAPAEVKGVALLVVNHPDRASDQWMWTPAIERDRRIALQDRSTRFFGTDFSFEDLEERDVDQYDYSLLGDEPSTARRAGRFESTPKQAKSSQYTRSIVWIRKDNYAFARIENFVKDQVVRRLNYARHRERAGHLDRAAAGDGRPAAQQPHEPDARQAAVQRADEGRGLHAAGDPPPVIRRARCAWSLALWLGCAAACRRRRLLTQRGFVEARALLFPAGRAQRSTQRRRRICWRGEEVFVKPAPWMQFAAGLDLRANSHDQVDDSWRVDFSDRGTLRPALSVRRLDATLTHGAVHGRRRQAVHPLGQDRHRHARPIGSRRATSSTSFDNEFLAVPGRAACVSARGRCRSKASGCRVSRRAGCRCSTSAGRRAVRGRRLVRRCRRVDARRLAGGRAMGTDGRRARVRAVVLRRVQPSAECRDRRAHAVSQRHRPGWSGDLPASAEIEVPVRRRYPRIRTYGVDVALPTRWFTVKGEAAYFTTPDPATDEYVCTWCRSSGRPVSGCFWAATRARW